MTNMIGLFNPKIMIHYDPNNPIMAITMGHQSSFEINNP